MIEFFIAAKTPNPLNGAQWERLAKPHHRKRVREQFRNAARANGVRFSHLPAVVTLTRLSPGTLDAWDGLPAALKPVVDGIADALGIADHDPRVTWATPKQEKTARGTKARPAVAGVRVCIVSRIDPEPMTQPEIDAAALSDAQVAILARFAARLHERDGLEWARRALDTPPLHVGPPVDRIIRRRS